MQYAFGEEWNHMMWIQILSGATTESQVGQATRDIEIAKSSSETPLAESWMPGERLETILEGSNEMDLLCPVKQPKRCG